MSYYEQNEGYQEVKSAACQGCPDCGQPADDALDGIATQVLDEVIDSLDAGLEAAYEEGFNDGYNGGYDDGYATVTEDFVRRGLYDEVVKQRDELQERNDRQRNTLMIIQKELSAAQVTIHDLMKQNSVLQNQVQAKAPYRYVASVYELSEFNDFYSRNITHTHTAPDGGITIYI